MKMSNHDQACREGPPGDIGPKGVSESDIIGYEIHGHDTEEALKSTPADAIFAYLEYKDQVNWPERVIVQAYVRCEVKFPAHSFDLEDLYIALDEEYGDPNGDFEQGDNTLKKINDSFEAFCKLVEEEWEPWRCEPVPGMDQEVIVTDFLKLHDPSWLEKR